MKKCKVCGTKFKPIYSSVQMVCSPKCAIDYKKVTKAKNEKILDKAKKERKEVSDMKKSMKNTEVQVHKYVRDRDKGKPCISCGKPHDDSFQAGHLFSRKQFNSLRFDLDNIHGQCQHCNLRLEGNVAEYTLRLPERIGQKRFDRLVKLAQLEKKIIKQWTLWELKEIRNSLK